MRLCAFKAHSRHGSTRLAASLLRPTFVHEAAPQLARNPIRLMTVVTPSQQRPHPIQRVTRALDSGSDPFGHRMKNCDIQRSL